MSRNAEEANRQAKSEVLRDQTRGIRGWFYRSYIDAIQRALAGTKGRVLDIGCGEDIILGASPFPRVSLDIADVRLTRFTNRDRVCGDAMRLPFRAGSCSAIVLSAILEHLPDPGRALSEAARVLAPGGRVIVVIPNDILMTIGRLLLGLWPPRHPDHLVFLTPSRLVALAEGFEVEVQHGLPWTDLPFFGNMYWFAVLRKKD